jgi:hypothetical protein
MNEGQIKFTAKKIMKAMTETLGSYNWYSRQFAIDLQRDVENALRELPFSIPSLEEVDAESPISSHVMVVQFHLWPIWGVYPRSFRCGFL